MRFVRTSELTGVIEASFASIPIRRCVSVRGPITCPRCGGTGRIKRIK